MKYGWPKKLNQLGSLMVEIEGKPGRSGYDLTLEFDDKHVQDALRELTSLGFLSRVEVRVENTRRRKYVYDVTDQGRKLTRILRGVIDIEV